MDDVTCYYDEAEGGGVQEVAGLGGYVKAEDFHCMEADRDAQRLRADTAEQRIAELWALVEKAYDYETIDGDWIEEYRRLKPEVGSHDHLDDEALQRRHDDERREYFSDDQ